MREWHFFTAEEGIRYTAKTRGRGDRAPETDAGIAATGIRESAKAGQSVCGPRHPIRALSRLAFQRYFDDARRGTLTRGTHRAGKSERRRHCRIAPFCRRAFDSLA